MEKMSRLDINKLMERYIGSSGGYLGTFGSHPELLRFYVDCEVDVIPTDYPGSNKERFRAVLENASAADQARIIRGILKRHPAESSEARTQALHDEFLRMALSLEAGSGVANPCPLITSEFVELTLSEVERGQGAKGNERRGSHPLRASRIHPDCLPISKHCVLGKCPRR